MTANLSSIYFLTVHLCYKQLAEETENVPNWLSEYSLRFDTAWVATCQTKLKNLCYKLKANWFQPTYGVILVDLWSGYYFPQLEACSYNWISARFLIHNFDEYFWQTRGWRIEDILSKFTRFWMNNIICTLFFLYKKLEYPHSLKSFLDFAHFLVWKVS